MKYKNMRKYILLFVTLILAIPSFAQAATLGEFIHDKGTVYVISPGSNSVNYRRPFTSAGAFSSYKNHSWANVRPATTSDLSAASVGPFVPPREGSILCSDRGEDYKTCYLISNETKRGFTSSQIFLCLGYQFSNVYQGDTSWLAKGGNIDTCNQAHPRGTLILMDGQYYIVGNNGKHKVSSSDLETWGYSTIEAVPANSYDRNLPTLGSIGSRPAGWYGLPWVTSNTSSSTGATISTGTTISAPAASINFTINGKTSDTVKVGQVYRYEWSINNAKTYETSYKSNKTDSCIETPGSLTFRPWANLAVSGTREIEADKCRAGVTYTLRIQATGTDNVTIYKEVNLTVE